jgi:membrane-bound lytic murein transglycosylase A
VCGLLAAAAGACVTGAVPRPAAGVPPRVLSVRSVSPSVPAVASVRSVSPSVASPEASAFDALPGWREDAMALALPAWRRSCERLARARASRGAERDASVESLANWEAACGAIPAEGADDAAARAYFERWFTPVPVQGDDGPRGLFTGYYEPSLRGSRARHGRFTVPLHGRPADLVAGPRGVRRRARGRLRPYWTRAQIAAGAMGRAAPVLAWVDDATDAFFLEIQGSGRVTLEDGTVLQLNYAGSNGHPYVPIGRVLVERGAMARDAVSLQSIRAWLGANPRRARSVLNANPSYVFFRVSEDAGARGAEGVVLEPGRSMAVDRRYISLGTPIFLDVEPLDGVGPIRRLVVAQDTGGAIRGPVRGDLFWGAGPDAYERAGRMRHHGRCWRLAPRDSVGGVVRAEGARTAGETRSQGDG